MQNKTPNEAAAILKKWHEIKKQYNQITADIQRLKTECERLRWKIHERQFWYSMCLMSTPPTSDLAHITTGQLNSLEQAFIEDQKAGEATWALYETQKKMIESCNAFEEVLTFRVEHFILDHADEQEIEEEMVSLSATRRYIRELGPRVVNGRKRVMWEEANDSEYMD
jgi:hypothetical protein